MPMEIKRKPYEAIADYWDNRELSDANSEPCEVKVDLEHPASYFPVEKQLADQLKTAAAARGLSSRELLNRWVQQKIEEEVAPK
jgi:hypothetical protein